MYILQRKRVYARAKLVRKKKRSKRQRESKLPCPSRYERSVGVKHVLPVKSNCLLCGRAGRSLIRMTKRYKTPESRILMLRPKADPTCVRSPKSGSSMLSFPQKFHDDWCVQRRFTDGDFSNKTTDVRFSDKYTTDSRCINTNYHARHQFLS